MRPKHLVIFSFAMAALLLPCAARAQSCSYGYCESYAVYDSVYNRIVGYSSYDNWDDLPVMVESYIWDENWNCTYLGDAVSYGFTEVDFSYQPQIGGGYSIAGFNSYMLEGNPWAPDGNSSATVDVPVVSNQPQISYCDGPPAWVLGANSVTCYGSDLQDGDLTITQSGDYGNGQYNSFMQVGGTTVSEDGTEIDATIILGPVLYLPAWITLSDGTDYSFNMPEIDVPPPGVLSCAPGVVTRGDSVTCAVTNATVTQWEFQGDGVGVTGPAGGSTWAGPMVISGTVIVTVSGEAQLKQTITVNPRQNFPAVAMPTAQLMANGSSFNTASLPTLTSPPCQGAGCMGYSGYGWAYKISSPTITGGPNLGLYYVESLTDKSIYGWELNPGLTDSSDPFYQAQSGVCWAGIEAIKTAVQNHEIGQPSHYSEVANALASRNPATGAEAFIGGSVSRLLELISPAYMAAAAAGDSEPAGAYQLPALINYPPYRSCQ